MKIGILTFHCAHNYGAVLQAFALQEFLRSTGHQVEMIDYRPGYLTSSYDVINRKASLVRKIASLPFIPSRYLRYARFEKFINDKLALSPPAHVAQEIGRGYDAYVLGSDQIWNLKMTGNDLVFFGAFERSSGSRLISYAASTEAAYEGANIDLSAEKDWLREFSSLSVREDVLRKQVEPLVDDPVSTVLDPTLLVEPSIFRDFTNDQRQHGHLLVYQVKAYGNVISICEEVQRKNGIKRRIKLVPHVTRSELLNPYSSASPEDFVGLIKSAKFVVTTSFHGAVFAIMFNKQFVCVMNKGEGNSRISSLLKSLGIENRMIYSADEVPDDLIDYEMVKPRLAALRAASREFLLKAIS